MSSPWDGCEHMYRVAGRQPRLWKHLDELTVVRLFMCPELLLRRKRLATTLVGARPRLGPRGHVFSRIMLAKEMRLWKRLFTLLAGVRFGVVVRVLVPPEMGCCPKPLPAIVARAREWFLILVAVGAHVRRQVRRAQVGLVALGTGVGTLAGVRKFVLCQA